MIVIFTISKLLQRFPNYSILKRFPLLKDAPNLNIPYKTVLQIFCEKYLHISCPLKVGLQAPNINIILYVLGEARKKLLNMQQAGRPLVVNFGSCTWSPFMSNLDDFNKIVPEFDSYADFVDVYISEAHLLEGWTLKDNEYSISQHTRIQDRISAAEMLDTGIRCPVVMDTMENEGVYQYAALSEALYITEDGIIN